MKIGVITMNRGIILVSLLAASVPLRAGIVLTLDPTVSTPSDAGTYAGGTTLFISASGTVNLNAGSTLITNPDGSLFNPQPLSCVSCWQPGYTYFLEGQTNYPTTFGGDGINHFVGGGANYDAFNGSNPAFAAQGAQVTDTTAPGVLRFGALAGTFSANPSATDWFLIGYGGTFVVPDSGGTLQLVIVDTFYPNNTGGYTVSVDTTAVPEPSVAWLALSGIAFLGFRRYRARTR